MTYDRHPVSQAPGRDLEAELTDTFGGAGQPSSYRPPHARPSEPHPDLMGLGARESQPDPRSSGLRPLWPVLIGELSTRDLWITDERRAMLIQAMRNRDDLGRRRYGVPLTAHNGRDARRDARDEALDLMIYLRQMIEEGRTTVGGAAILRMQIEHVARIAESLL